MDYDILKRRFWQFGGFRLVWEYTRIGLLPVIAREFFRCLFKGESFKFIYPVISQKIDNLLVKKYLVECKDGSGVQKSETRRVWFCWLQGLKDAPRLVKACLTSLQRSITDRDIVVIDAENWKCYVDLPDYVVNKWEKGIIPPALFSDMLRLQLLIKYGGSWIDSTVLCTVDQIEDDACRSLRVDMMNEYLDAELFLYQYTSPGSSCFGGISNWFISACSNHPLLIALRDSLYAYWKDNNCVLEYYIFHCFFAELVKENPRYIDDMLYGYSRSSLALMSHWNEPFDENQWRKVTLKVIFHKLSFRAKDATQNDKGNYYNEIIERYKQ